MNTKNLVFTKKNLQFKKGEAIFKEGDEGKEMYFIDSGEVQIVKTIGGTDIKMAILSSGDFFGEMALITGNKRIASTISLTDCNLHAMDKETFKTCLLSNKNFMNRILDTLAHRLEETDLNLSRLLKTISKLPKALNMSIRSTSKHNT